MLSGQCDIILQKFIYTYHSSVPDSAKFPSSKIPHVRSHDEVWADRLQGSWNDVQPPNPNTPIARNFDEAIGDVCR